MAIILSIETSTTVCSAALHDKGKLIATAEVHLEYSHSTKLAILINEVNKFGSIGITQVQAVAISSGPGSYTGLRIGTSFAKGLCYALSVPLIAVNTLELLAYKVGSVNKSGAFLCPMIDARRMEVYCQVFDSNLTSQEVMVAKIIDEKSFENYLKIKPVVFFGSGAKKCETLIRNNNAKFLDGIIPSASTLGEIAFRKYEVAQTEDLVDFVPLYLKEFFSKEAFAKLN